MKKFIITEEERSRILGMHQSATSKQYLKEEVAPTGATQTPTQQNIKREFVIVQNGTSVGMSSIDTDVRAVITKLNDKNGVYYSVEFKNTPTVDNLIYRPGQGFKTDSVVNADPSKFGISTTDKSELYRINALISNKIRAAAESQAFN